MKYEGEEQIINKKVLIKAEIQAVIKMGRYSNFAKNMILSCHLT